MKRLFIIILLLLAVAPLPLLAQSPKHEVRAVWLTTLNGLDWPSSTNADKQRQQLEDIIDQLKAGGINTVLVQTRIRATTLYPSEMEPWDASLTGTLGRSPGYDPLQFCIDLCHERGMECHAWVVTIPVGKWGKAGCQHLRKTHPKLVKRIGDEGYMDPEQAATADYLARICGEIVHNYDIDGIHLDYIRYPETWKLKGAAARQKGRQHITSIVRKIAETVRREKPWVKLSCSPIGKHDDLTRYRSGGWNARTAVCQDAQAWLRDGLMDMLFPMMYFQGNNFYPFAIDWQEQSNGRLVVPGLGIYFLDPREGRWTLDVVERQLHVLRQLGMGHCYFRSRFFTDNVKGIYNLAQQLDAIPALVPPMTWAGKQAPTAPTQISLDKGRLTWNGATDRGDSPYLLYNIYASEDFPVDVTKAENLVAIRQTATQLAVPPSANLNFAVTAMDRYGQESQPAQLLINAGPAYAAPIICKTDGRIVALPPKPSTLDADVIVVETLLGQAVASSPYTPCIDISALPDGIYQLRSLGRKGRSHRIGFFSIKRQ
ncbi:MAG: family 10 glycosylhydrolase [Prevotella sp.]|nr:family 10 glycosylhydrolase [Prevotella sp.]